MEYKTAKKDDGLSIELSGQFTFMDSPKCEHMVRLLDEEGLRFLHIDFSLLTFIDSAGLGMLLMIRDICQNKHIPISLLSAHGQVQKVFMISKFDQLFTLKS